MARARKLPRIAQHGNPRLAQPVRSLLPQCRAGSSLRGLSVVTMATSAPLATASPMGARLEGSRSPPHPNTQIKRRGRVARSADKTLVSASGV